MLTFISTQRGFRRAEFVDRYQSKCSIQASSLATEPCIWLGTGDRMHLTQAMVADLLPYLQHFVETGELEQCENRLSTP